MLSTNMSLASNNCFKDQSENLLLLWEIHQDVVSRILYRYKWIEKDEYDDYRQEIFMSIWKRYDNWINARNRGCEFIQWIWNESRNAVINYRCRQLHISGRNPQRRYQNPFRYIDDMTMFQIKDEQYNEDNIIALNKAIKDLSKDEQDAIQIFLDGDELTDTSIIKGKDRGYFSRLFVRAKGKIRKRKNAYFVDMPNYHKPIVKQPKPKNEKCRLSKSIRQFDLSGCLIETWPSVNEVARRTGLTAKSISNVATGRKYSYAGFRWIYVDEENLSVINKTKKVGGAHKKPIKQLTPSGELIRVWPSIKSAVAEGFDELGIISAAKGKRPNYKGFMWQYA